MVTLKILQMQNQVQFHKNTWFGVVSVEDNFNRFSNSSLITLNEFLPLSSIATLIPTPGTTV